MSENQDKYPGPERGGASRVPNYNLSLELRIEKNGQPFFLNTQVSYGLDAEQVLDMEADLIALRKKWEKLSGIPERSTL